MRNLGLALGVASIAIYVGCTSETLRPVDEIGDGGNGGTPITDGGAGGSGGIVPETYTRGTMSGDITWNVTFDDVAKANGATDCSYTRHYEAVEDGSAPWQCPDCDIIYRADVEVVDGLDDCYPQVSTATPATVEWLGRKGNTWWRGGGATMTEQGMVTATGDTIAVENDVADVEIATGGTLGFEVRGNLTLGEGEGDPLNGFRTPEAYACGWPKADSPAYSGNYVLAVGATVPDGVFYDICQEPVRIHDFAGDYLVIDMSAMDCPPCRQMASLEETFVAGLAQQGIDVHVITLLAPALNNTLGETTNQMLTTWRDDFALASPILADRGWGLSIFEPALTEQVGYPSWVIVAPNLEVIEFNSGFGGWSSFADTILAHAATQ